MDPYSRLLSQIPLIEKTLHYSFEDSSLLALAFVHRSFENEQKTPVGYNERLEFLGDSVLGLLISDYLYRRLPETAEGELSHLRARLVEASSCVKYLLLLGVEKFLLLGRGEKMNDGRGRDTILADLFEAIVGAIYLDGGLPAANLFFFRHFQKEIETILQAPLHNWKAILQDYCQKNYQITPIYKLIEELGPDHSKRFTVQALLQEEKLGLGTGASKKEAQQAAAKNALDQLQVDGISLS